MVVRMMVHGGSLYYSLQFCICFQISITKSKKQRRTRWACFLAGCHLVGLALSLPNTYRVNHQHIPTHSKHSGVLCIKLLQRCIWTHTPPFPKVPKTFQRTSLIQQPLPIMGSLFSSDPHICCVYLLLFKKLVQIEGTCLAKEVVATWLLWIQAWILRMRMALVLLTALPTVLRTWFGTQQALHKYLLNE